MKRTSFVVMLLIVLFSVTTGLYGIKDRGIVSWDEGVYYDEARYLYLSLRMAARLAGEKLSGQQQVDIAALKGEIPGLPPRMGRPLNCVVNTLGMGVFGDRTWVPSLVSVLFGLGCIAGTYLLLRRRGGEVHGLVAAFVLALSPYFFTYRRLGLCEAGGAFFALLCVGLVWWAWEQKDGPRARRITVLLGVLCGLAFGINTRVLLLLPVLTGWRLWRLWRTTPEKPLKLLLTHGALVVLGFAAVLFAYELPYLLAAPLAARYDVSLESYFTQLQRFAAVQKGLAGAGVGTSLSSIGFFLLHYEGLMFLPVLGGMAYSIRQRNGRMLMICSLVLLAIAQNATLIAYARYQSWILPLLALLAGYAAGEWLKTRRNAPGTSHGRPSALIAAALLVFLALHSIHALHRSLPTLAARSGQPEIMAEARQHGAELLVSTNLSQALSLAPLFPLENMRQLPYARMEAAEMLQEALQHGDTMVVLDTQQYARYAVLATVEEYEQSAATLIGRKCTPVRSLPHVHNLFFFFCVEHNRDYRETLRVYRAYRDRSSSIHLYDGAKCLQVLLGSAGD